MQDSLQAVKRNTSHKAKQLRKEGWIPCSLYGKGYEPTLLQVRNSDFKKMYSKGARKFYVEVTGGQKYLCSIDEVQKGPFQNEYVHVNFHALNQNEKATIHVPVHFHGTAPGTKEGGVIAQQTSEVTITGFPNDLPDEVVVDVSSLELGHGITIADIKDQFKFEFSESDWDKVLVNCNFPKLQPVDEAPAEEVVAEATEEVVAETEEKQAA
jgi:large subunit ribosomal protein L25